MDRMENLPWYKNYMLILEQKQTAEKEIEDFENSEKQLQRIKRFYQKIGAACSKNQWISKEDDAIALSNREETGRLSQLKSMVDIGTVLEKVVQIQDDESINALLKYINDERYNQLIQRIMFFLEVSKAKQNPDYFKQAYNAVYHTYPLNNMILFKEEGVYYYLYYFQCLQSCMESNRNGSSYEKVCSMVKERLNEAKAIFNHYLSDKYLSKEAEMVFSKIYEVEALLK